jgi:hypothetical protein
LRKYSLVSKDTVRDFPNSEAIHSNQYHQDAIVEQCRRTFAMPKVSQRDLDELKAWTVYKGCIATAETRYLNESDDLFALSEVSDDALSYVEGFLEDIFIWLERKGWKVCPAIEEKGADIN